MGDLTADGLDDVVVSDHQAIHVFAGQPNGSFDWRPVGFYEKTWHNGRNFTATGFFLPLSGALADLDGDDDLDLVVGTGGRSPTLHLFRNTGRGGLDKQTTLSGSASPHRLWVVDFTGDGVVDILWWTADLRDGGTLFLHEGRGPFRFADPVAVAAARGRPFALADLDGDGHRDFALHRPEGLVVLFGGRGGFATKLEWASPHGEVRHAALAGGPVVPGRAVLATGRGLVSGHFTKEGFEPTEFLPLGPLSWVHLMDLTGDGTEDGLVQTRTGWTVLAGKAGGGFHRPSSEFLVFGNLALGGRGGLSAMTLAGQPAIVVGTEPFPSVYRIGAVPRGESLVPFREGYLLAVGDLSGNGAPDVVVGGAHGVDVLWNDGNGGFVRLNLLQDDVHVLTATVEGGLLYLLNLIERDRGWAAVELWTVSPRGEVRSRDILEKFRLDQANRVQPTIVVTDLDGDGAQDVLLLEENAVLVKWSQELWVRYPWGEGNLGLAVCGQFTRTDLPEVALVSDVGVFYAAFAQRSLFVNRAPFGLDQFPLNVACGDMDGDGLDDLVLLTLDVRLEIPTEKLKELKMTLFEVHGRVLLAAGKVVEVALPKFGDQDAPWPLRGLVVGDFTDDGKKDLAFTTTHGAGVFVLAGRGDGTFDPGFRIPRAMGPLIAADLDGNGHPELVGSSVGFNPCLWIRWNGGDR